MFYNVCYELISNSINVCQAWATYGPRDPFMRPAGTYKNINTYRKLSRELFFALPTSAALILAVVYDIFKYHSSDNLAGQRQGLHYLQGWEKSIPLLNCDILYFLFIECTGALSCLNEYPGPAPRGACPPPPIDMLAPPQLTSLLF